MTDKRFLAFLDAISRCFLDGDFEMWRTRVLYPLTLITSSGPILISSDESLRRNFDLYQTACKTMHLDAIVRTPMKLEDCRDGTWIGTYETNLLSQGTRVTPPYVSSALLRDVSGTFKMISVLNARGHQDWTGKSSAKKED